MSTGLATNSAGTMNQARERPLRTALVHHWLVTWRGGEKVLEQLCALFPEADIFTLLCDHENMRVRLSRRPIRTSFLQRLPKATKWYPYYLPLFPLATTRLDLSGYKLVITSDAATLKGVRTDLDAVHICYCHTPMRYVWSGFQDYRRSLGPVGRAAFAPLAAWLRRWDSRSSQGVTQFVANSLNVRDRIRRYYGRDSVVIYPPVDTERFSPVLHDSARGNFFLYVSQLVPYKRADLVVEAFSRCRIPLIVIGDGSERKRLMRSARSNIQFLGPQPDVAVRDAMRGCRALVFAGEEDFGIVMAEAQACGKPIIAYDRGGAREIVADGVTGILFGEQSLDSLLDGLDRFMRARFDVVPIRASAEKFGNQRFRKEFAALTERILESRQHPT